MIIIFRENLTEIALKIVKENFSLNPKSFRFYFNSRQVNRIQLQPAKFFFLRSTPSVRCFDEVQVFLLWFRLQCPLNVHVAYPDLNFRQWVEIWRENYLGEDSTWKLSPARGKNQSVKLKATVLGGFQFSLLLDHGEGQYQNSMWTESRKKNTE